ncbi:MAG: hypothetical protein A2158_03130 [Chloroflexi bacterium RBG_13_46_14]|nr:MAG: hypothetical protein A2158_03130 [Chloroflexi bacterium RBG_13_46_14]
MGAAIEYQKVMTEIVYINLPGPIEPDPGMSGGELLHGFLAELYTSTNLDGAANNENKNFINLLCTKWNIRFR